MVTISLTDPNFRTNLIGEFKKHDFEICKGCKGNYFSFKYKKTQFFRFELKQHSSYKSYVTGKKETRIHYLQNSVKTSMEISNHSGNISIDFETLKEKYDARIETHKENLTNKNISNFKETLYLALLNEHLKPIFGEIHLGYRFSISLQTRIKNTYIISITTREMSKREFGNVDFDSIMFETRINQHGVDYYAKLNIDALSELLKNLKTFEDAQKEISTKYNKKEKEVYLKIKALENSIKPELRKLEDEIKLINNQMNEELKSINILDLINAKSRQ